MRTVTRTHTHSYIIGFLFFMALIRSATYLSNGWLLMICLSHHTHKPMKIKILLTCFQYVLVSGTISKFIWFFNSWMKLCESPMSGSWLSLHKCLLLPPPWPSLHELLLIKVYQWTHFSGDTKCILKFPALFCFIPEDFLKQVKEKPG